VSALPAFAVVAGGDLELRVKAVPGARRDELAGLLGDRLKIRVSAPPEGGRANGAICELLASRLGVSARSVEVAQGLANPLKTVRVRGAAASAVELCARLSDAG
jgi:uncharacterized protein (TIGR00251 family)